MGYRFQAVKGISWIGALRITTRILAFFRYAILGRILTPHDFGLFGIASLLLSFLEIITETGVNIVLIQQKSDIKEYFHSAWIVSIMRGIVLSLLIILCAPLISKFFNATASYPIILAIALVPLIRGFINPAIVLFHKELQFQKEFWFRFILFAVDTSTAIIIAFLTKSALSFVGGLIASALVEVIGSFLIVKLRPKLRFEVNKIKYILQRGWWVTITGVFSYIADQGDNIVVGRLLGTSALGIYQIAYKISTLTITEITDVVNKVVFPVYIKFANDRKRLLTAFLKVTGVTSLGALVIASGLFIFAHEIILLLMGQQWLDAVPVIKILAIYGFLRTLFGNLAPVFLAIERQDYIAKMTFFRVLGLLITIIPFVIFYGLVGAGFSALASIIAEIPIALYFLIKTFHK